MEWNPEDYVRNSSAQVGWARELIAHLDLHGDEVILDVGCGDGRVTAVFAETVPEGFVLGVDSSAAFIDYARAHFPADRHPNLRFEPMDARELASDRQFDLVFSNAALHWMEDHRAFLAGCQRLLKTGGRLVISCGGAGNAADVAAVMDVLMADPRWAGYFADFKEIYYFYSPEQYQEWLPEAGFTATRLELVSKDMVHEGREGLLGWMRTTWLRPFLVYIPEELREEFSAATVDGYLAAHPLDPSGHSHVRMVRLEVEARKEK
jgi:trans-aconitate 2-methyltransferase